MKFRIFFSKSANSIFKIQWGLLVMIGHANKQTDRQTKNTTLYTEYRQISENSFVFDPNQM